MAIIGDGRFSDLFRRNRAWAWMLAVNIAALTALVIYVLRRGLTIQYSYLLATYEFGLIRRAFIGSILALFESKVRSYEVYVIGGAAWGLAIVLYVILFRRTFGFQRDRLPLFVMTFGSPFFFKNFFHTLGFFDIYGCLLGLGALLIPVNSLYLAIVTLGCVIALLIHQLHFLLYISTVGFIVLVRYYFMRPLSIAGLCYGALAAIIVCATFILMNFYGTPPVPQETFWEHLLTRAADPVPVIFLPIWYSTLADELAQTAAMWQRQILRTPVYIVLIAIHWPVGRFMAILIAAIDDRLKRGLVIAGLVGITVGYVCIFVVAYDYSRWVSNWGVCMFLAVHALAMLLAHEAKTIPAFLDEFRDEVERAFGWIVTAIPRVGIYIPF